MKITIKEVTIAELFNGYKDNGENGIVGYGGKLDIRPAYQREFVYKDAQRDAVINSVRKGFPLNVMYWAKTGPDTYEVLDGQQRTISICQFLNKEFSIVNENGNPQYIHNIQTSSPNEYKNIMDYKLTIYECEGTHEEKLSWFKTINIAGAVLTEQELRNAVYTGYWLSDAKRYFSKRNCAAYNLGKKYLKGDVIRQDYLETAIKWIADRDGIVNSKNEDSVSKYMAIHQNDIDAQEIWLYFQDVIQWVQSRFPNYRKEMKGVDWGYLYNRYKDVRLNPNDVESKIKNYMLDDDVTKKSGIYPYLLTGKEKYLSIREFTESQKREAYEKQNGICPYCHENGNDKVWDISEMEADHIIPWSKGGKTCSDNCQMLCKDHNRSKSAK